MRFSPLRTTARAALVLLPAAAVALCAPAAAAAPRAADDDAPAGTVTWALAPADAHGADGRISLRHDLDPGSAVDDHVLLSNFSAEPTTFVLYAGDGVVGDGGAFDIATGEPEDGGSWVALGPVGEARADPDGRLALELPPESSVVVPVHVAVPDDATPGDHPAGVVAELAPDGDAVEVASRVGVRLHLRVTGDVAADLAVRDVRATWVPSWNPLARGHVHVTYAVGNAGNVRLGATSTATATGLLGLGTASRETAQRELLPGDSARVEVDLPAWPTLRTGVEVSALPGAVGEDALDAPLREAVATATAWTVPWSQLALLLLLVGVPVALRRVRRRSAARVQARIDAAVARARAEAVTEPGPAPAPGPAPEPGPKPSRVQ